MGAEGKPQVTDDSTGASLPIPESNDDGEVREAIWCWLDGSVIGLDLCPFAGHARRHGHIRITFIKSDTVETALAEIAREMIELTGNEDADATVLLALTRVAADFEDFLDLLALVNALLTDLGLAGEIQVASFHPEYCFSGALPQARGNFTNRSPVPILHLLQEASVSRALAHFDGDPAAIPVRNVALLEGMSDEEFERVRKMKQKKG